MSMTCPNCDHELKDNITAHYVILSSGDEAISVQVECTICESRFFAYIKQIDLIEVID